LSTPIDWETVARQIGALRTDERGVVTGEQGGSALAREALCLVLGADELRRAVDYYVGGEPGAELARSVLWLLRPWEAMDRCHEIWADRDGGPGDAERRRRAIELLRVVADRPVLPWIPGLLADDDPVIRDLAAQIVDQLVFAGLVDAEEVAPVLSLVEAHPDEAVRDRARGIAERLESSSG
jgi:hypothetical protein